MSLQAPPRARLLQGLLLLTLMLGAVCGVPTETSPSSSVQTGSHPEQAEENAQVRENQKPAGKGRNSSAQLAANGILWPTSQGGDKVVADDALPVESRIPEDTGNMEQDGSAKKPGMRRQKNQGPDPGVPGIGKKSDGDTCDKWMSCNGGFLLQYLKFVEQELPSCPCVYPAFAIHSAVAVFDERLGRWFRWRDASDPEDLLPVYQPSASLCLRSLLPEDSSSLATQLCCYDGRHRLLTRGKGAGTPKLISPDYSPDLHFMVERFPWVFCKGDWSRVHQVLPPNNGLACPPRPSTRVYQAQLQEANKS